MGQTRVGLDTPSDHNVDTRSRHSPLCLLESNNQLWETRTLLSGAYWTPQTPRYIRGWWLESGLVWVSLKPLPLPYPYPKFRKTPNFSLFASQRCLLTLLGGKSKLLPMNMSVGSREGGQHILLSCTEIPDGKNICAFCHCVSLLHSMYIGEGDMTSKS